MEDESKHLNDVSPLLILVTGAVINASLIVAALSGILSLIIN